jgi:hypothetical protein
LNVLRTLRLGSRGPRMASCFPVRALPMEGVVP